MRHILLGVAMATALAASVGAPWHGRVYDTPNP